jgi:biotin carboxyl carrier protein
MPGTILRIAVAAGAQVERGQDLLVLEAMKMENVIRAPRAGRVAALCVQAGQQVAHGELLLRFDADEAGSP